MQSSPRKKLIHIERQYNTIKEIIPEANTLLSDSAIISRKLKKAFIFYSIQWEKIQADEKSLFHPKDLNSAQKEFFSTTVMEMMESLVQTQRVTKEALATQKSLKITLFELLVRLKDQVMQGSPFDTLPSFFNHREVNTQALTKVKYKFLNIGSIGINQINFELQKKEIPESLKNLLQQAVKDTYDLSHLVSVDKKNLSAKMSHFEKSRKRAKRQNKQFEAAAFTILSEMIMCQWELANHTTLLFEKKYDILCEKIKKGNFAA